MTEPLQPPAKKNPQLRSPLAFLPPVPRSRAALGLTARAAEGRFALQQCAECGAVQYPPRDACCKCLSTDLPWTDQPPHGELIAETTVRISPDLYFRNQSPWRMGTVRLASGVSVLCHLHGDVRKGPVRLALLLDRAGQGTIMALPEQEVPNMADDPQLRELGTSPKHRRVLITDARAANAPALVRALLDAGAAMVFVGESEGWRRWPGRAALDAMERVEIVPLDVTDSASVREAAGTLGGKTDILINNAVFLRPGGALDRSDTVFAQQELEVNYLGLMRLAQAFGPAMRARGGDGINSAAAWVNILSANALAADPTHAGYSAASAAALSLTQSLRADLRGGGVRVMTVLTGPTDDEWYAEAPPPKLAPRAVARAIVDGLERGLEEVACGDIARDLVERWRQDAKVLERELAEGAGR
ncbi:SDR family NAD(P)-dependent oxidoreductase [Rhodobacteraceae bacterium F11138]|nr:SDR family NAD(P)-dependent oxidoreductase [Rhodobacteraceae bacterium F11138]